MPDDECQGFLDKTEQVVHLIGNEARPPLEEAMGKRLAGLLGLGLLLAVFACGCSFSVNVPPPGYIQTAAADTLHAQGEISR